MRNVLAPLTLLALVPFPAVAAPVAPEQAPWPADATNFTLLVFAGPANPAGKFDKPNVKQLRAGNNTFTLMALTKGNPPDFKTQGDTVTVGQQIVSYDGQKITLAK